MSSKGTKNIAASVLARLRNQSKSRGTPFQQVLQQYAIEWFLYRKGKADQASLVALIRDCATLEVEADGLAFLADSIVAEEITKDSEYAGTRILMDARMDNVRLKIQVDFGVGDVMVPGPRMIEYPVLMNGGTIQLLAYPIESAIAEKLQAIVALGDANSRIWKAGSGWVAVTPR